MHFKWNAVQANILTLISSYLFIECFKSQVVFCTVFLLTIAFILCFNISFNFIICCTKSEIHKFIIPKSFLQLKYILLIYWPLKCEYANYIVPIRYIQHQIDNIHSSRSSMHENYAKLVEQPLLEINLSNIDRSLHIYTSTDSDF